MTDDTPDLQDILIRLGRLEAQNRKLKWGGVSILVVLSGFVLMGQSAPTPQVIEAQRFVLKDAKGNVRAWLGLFGKGSELVLGNVNKESKMSLKVSEDASDLHFYGGVHSGMNLGVDVGKPAISMADAEANGSAEISFSTAAPAMSLHHGKGFSTTIGASPPKAQAGGEAQHTSAAPAGL